MTMTIYPTIAKFILKSAFTVSWMSLFHGCLYRIEVFNGFAC